MALTVNPNVFWSAKLDSLNAGSAFLKPIDPNYVKAAKTIQSLVQTPHFQKRLSAALPQNQNSAAIQLAVYDTKVTATLHGKAILEIPIGDVQADDEMGTKALEIFQVAKSILPGLNTTTVKKEEEDEFFDALDDTGPLLDPLQQATPAPLVAKPLNSGIQNSGSTCYAASATQLFRHIPSLRAAVMQLPPALRDPILAATTGSELITAVNTVIVETRNQFRVGAPYDAQEFYNAILNVIPNDSLLYTPMQTTTTFYNTTEKRQATSNQTQPRLSLQIPLETQERKAIHNFDEALRLSLNEEPDLAKDPAHAIHRFKSSPKHLFLQLKRKMRDEVSTAPRKLTQDLQNVPYILDLGKQNALISSAASEPMELKGVIVHIGNATNESADHYISYFQADDGKWFCANDSIVREVKLKDVLKAAKQASDIYYDSAISDAGKKALAEPNAPSDCILS